jgi:hypothetical protein
MLPLILRVCAVAALFMPLGGCVEGQRAAHAACLMQSLNRNFKDVDPRRIDTDAVSCMRDNGYVRRASSYCPFVPLENAPVACYQPDDVIGALLWPLDMWVQSH